VVASSQPRRPHHPLDRGARR